MQGMAEQMTGVCRFCGQTIITKAETQEEADRAATMNCGCPGAEIERTKESVREELNELIGEMAPDNGWEPARPNVFNAVAKVSDCVVEGTITSATFRISETNLKIGRNKGKISVQRTKTITQGGTIEK